jgi:hypothetical protein
MEAPLLSALTRFADEVGRRLETGGAPTKSELGDILAAARSVEAGDDHEDPEPVADERQYLGEVRVHRRPPGGRNAPVTQHAGDLANDLLSLQRLADRGFGCLMIYFTDEIMAGYLSSPGNGLNRLYDLKPSEAYLVTKEFLGRRAKSFRDRLKDPLLDVHVRGLVRRDYPRGYALRLWEVVARDATSAPLQPEDQPLAHGESPDWALSGEAQPAGSPAAPDRTTIDKSDVVLLGCVKEKRSTRSAAKDLYISDLFGKRRTYAEASQKVWFILSAKLGLVEPDEEIDPYDLRLDELSAREQEEWGRQVVQDLVETLGPLEGLLFEVHAGAPYRRAIAAPLSLEGAKLVNPLEGLRFGEQLSWYGRSSSPSPPSGPSLPQSAEDKPQALSKILTAAFQSGGLDLSGRAGAPTPGWGGDARGRLRRAAARARSRRRMHPHRPHLGHGSRQGA